MALPPFAALEARLAARVVGALANLALTDGVASYTAVLDRNVQRIGEHGQFVESRDQLTFSKADAPRLAAGLVLRADPAVYSVDQLLAMAATVWTLDALESDDGAVAVWWVRS